METITIYGWAFTPPTLAHKTVITSLLSRWLVDRIIFTPDGERADKSYALPENHRQNIILTFYEALKNEWWNIDLDAHFLEWKNGGKTSTLDVDRYFTELLWYSPYHIFWIDVISWMKNWKGNSDGYIEHTLKKIFIPRKWYHVPQNIPLHNCMMTDIEVPEISSTLVRERLKVKKSVAEILMPEVLTYIEKHSLFT